MNEQSVVKNSPPATRERQIFPFLAGTLALSAVMALAVTIGGWSEFAGAKGLQLVAVLTEAILIWPVLRYSHAVLPVCTAVAVVTAIITFVAAPSWFARDNAFYLNTTLSANIIGVLLLLLACLQILVVALALLGLQTKSRRHP